MKNLEKLMMKKKDEAEMDPMEKAAKMTMLQQLRNHMVDMMHDGMADHNMKKVEVSGNDKGAVMDGLDKAKAMMVDSDDNGMDADPSDGEDMMNDSHGDEAADEISDLEGEDLSDQDIADLERLLAKAKSKKMSM